ncbi:myo-inosose-2 dehydratase [Campylobacter sp. MIT 21-1685]|uniref:myo-inosose-2 dehydratase n=1 Tax=unclassified Campylobacter TaxID=2593542 RepID=UPI00224AC836|nr:MULTISPECIES: myo-inosose-2 dehydratase [unclassified Campylobacter]MCX2682509.1 myo-inosose-2 dehydratase [Campylobacter sp. MIT 21-1684]MCX2750778.1 myo-inosose-2 dehydratase [Campylobacter sp. MIT 21-1682]MCX2806990.1 myo-inosose-2 dehydratase [Campylobacter sp. MIT 21-1685]
MNDEIGVKIAISPIAWSNDDLRELGGETSLQTFLDDAKNIGFDGVELGSKFPNDKKELKSILKDYNLELAGGWFSGNLLINSLEEEKENLLKEIERRVFNGCSNIVYAECSNTIQGKAISLSKKPILSNDEMKKYAEKYSILHDFVKQNGVTLAYHHHMGTIIQTAQEVDLFLRYCSKEVGLTFDTGHFYFAGAHPLYELQKHTERIYHIHLKDVRENIKRQCLQKDCNFLEAVLEGIFTTPGNGAIDFCSIIECLKENKYSGWIVIEAEQDPRKADPFEYSQAAFEFIQGLLQEKDKK